MKYTFALAAMAGSAIAGYVHQPQPPHQEYPAEPEYPTKPPHGDYQTVTSEYEVTYTTLCPVTETKTEPGNTYVVTKTEYSAVTTKLATTYYETVHGPDVTHYEEAVHYTTVESLCPVTETKTVAGEVVTVTWTSTSTIQKPVTATEYVTYATTVHASTEVYETCPVTVETTISKGETHYLTKTGTETYFTTLVHQVTEVVPVTKTVEVETTVTHAATEGQTVTEYPEVVVTVTHAQTVSQAPPPPATVTQPVTISTSVSQVTTVSQEPATSSIPVAAGAQATPAAALLLGALGIAALL